MSETQTRKYATHANPHDRFGRGGIAHPNGCGMGGVNSLSPCTATAVVAAPRWGSKALCFRPPPSIHVGWCRRGRSGLLSVCLCLQLLLLSTVRGEVMASCSFFPRCLSIWSQASSGRLCITAVQPRPYDQRGECRHPEECLLRNSASSDCNLFSHI